MSSTKYGHHDDFLDHGPPAVKRLIDEEGVILTAIERESVDEEGNPKIDITVNPGYDFVLDEGDHMFVIAMEEPEIQ